MNHAASNATVRPATSTDLDELVNLGMEIVGLHRRGRPDLFAEPESGALRSFFRERLMDKSHVLVADADGRVIGYIFAEHHVRDATPFQQRSSVMYVHHIAVAAEQQSNGIGTLLLAAIDQLAATAEASAVRLESWQFNEDAHAFFRARGFKPVRVVFEKLR